MKVVLAVAALVAVAGAASVSHEELEFRAWKLQHGKSYGSEEEESQRKMTWLNNRKLVLEHNMLADQGLKSYRLGMNIFADMDDQEYQARFASCLRSFNRTKTHPAASFHRQAEAASLPKAVNWKDKGYVTAVKDQLKCGSCWAFSATGALEGQIFKKTGKLVSLSEQQLVDCSWVEGNNGCKGGTMKMALEYVKDKGLQTEESYPYTEKEGKCRFNKDKVYATCRDVKVLNREQTLHEAVAKEGPISAGIDVSRITFRLYDSGVYDDPFCSSSSLNHAVLVVGYDVTVNGQEYWLVKNSWGVAWGEKGYIKMARNKNMCGIASNAVYPVV
ncbi:procathepsin L-like [Astyanax mexicanus]|uniref:procathepsin L-like n=1 Tax=Astyanax mexicanus TaxID=7994 RepID=UPI0020CB30B3|nr:procathepsin L-like [Astyanax mexicanus]